MDRTTVDYLRNLYGGKENVIIFCDNGRLFSEDDRNVLVFDDANEMVHVISTDNTLINNKNVGLISFEYGEIQFLDTSLSKEDALILINESSSFTSAMTEIDMLKVKLGYDLITYDEKIIVLDDPALSLDDFTKFKYKAIYNMFENANSGTIERERLLTETLITQEQYNKLEAFINKI